MAGIQFTVGMGQTLVEGGHVDANLVRAEAMIGQAAEADCDVVVLPECLDIGWTFPDAPALAETIPGPNSDRLCAAAQKHNLHVVAGLTERAGDRIYNAAILISPAGEILLKHRKVNILTIAQDIYAIGNTLGVAETPFGTIGVDICADNFPSCLALGHSLGRMGAQIILSPCAWAVDADHDNVKKPYGYLWRDSYSELAGGEVLAEGPYGEAAEALTVVSVETVRPQAKGTAIAKMLEARDYTGP